MHTSNSLSLSPSSATLLCCCCCFVTAPSKGPAGQWFNLQEPFSSVNTMRRSLLTDIRFSIGNFHWQFIHFNSIHSYFIIIFLFLFFLSFPFLFLFFFLFSFFFFFFNGGEKILTRMVEFSLPSQQKERKKNRRKKMEEKEGKKKERKESLFPCGCPRGRE